MSEYDIQVVKFDGDDYKRLLKEGFEVVDAKEDLRTLRRPIPDKPVPFAFAKI